MLKIHRIAGAAVAATALAAGLALASAGAASAAPAAGCSGGNCSLNGTVTVIATITLTDTSDTFTVPGPVVAGATSGAPSGTAPNQQQDELIVNTGDSNGYQLFAVAGTDWVWQFGSTVTFPATDTIIDQPNANGCWGQAGGSQCGSGEIPNVTLPEPGSAPALIDSSAQASATNGVGDVYPFADIVTIPAQQRAGAYSIAEDFSAIGS